MSDEYAALMLDMKKSRSLSVEKRQNAQEDLADALDCANALFQAELEMPLMFSAGDELQGLFRSVASAFLAFRYLKILVQSVELRGGIGIGEWTTRMESAYSTEQDGSAYHRSRSAIVLAEKDRLGDLLFVDSNGVSRDRDLSTSGCLDTLSRRTDSQRISCEIMELLRPLVPISEKNSVEAYGYQALAAKRLGEKYGASFSKDDICSIELGRSVNDDIEAQRAAQIGIGRHLAKLLGISRQGMEKRLKSARFVQERESAIFAYCYLNRLGES